MKIKRLSETVKLPTIAYKGDAGIDCYYDGNTLVIPQGEQLQVKLNIAIEIEQDEVCIVSERSGHAIKNGLHTIGNIIDSNYRGCISAIIRNEGNETYRIFDKDKICQLIIAKLGNRDIVEVSELSDSQRGELAHNSSKNN